MRRTTWTRAVRPITSLAAFGLVLGACVAGDSRPARYGGGYYGGAPGYYGSPIYGGGYGGGYGGAPYGGYGRSYAPRREYYGGGGGYGGGGSPRRENWTQDRLRQHWIDQSRQAR